MTFPSRTPSLARDAKRWHRLWSLRLALLGAAGNAAIGALWYFTDGVTRAALVCFGLNVGWYTAVAIARVWKQRKLETGDGSDD